MIWSTVINMVMIYDKKVVFVLDSCFRKLKTWNQGWVPAFHYIGFEPLFIDETDETLLSNHIKRVDPILRKEYIHEYICDNEDNRLTVEQIEEIINSGTR